MMNEILTLRSPEIPRCWEFAYRDCELCIATYARFMRDRSINEFHLGSPKRLAKFSYRLERVRVQTAGND